MCRYYNPRGNAAGAILTAVDDWKNGGPMFTHGPFYIVLVSTTTDAKVTSKPNNT